MNGSRTIRVMLVDDHPVFRIGMGALLDTLQDIEVVAQASSRQEAHELAGRLQPDVIVMDLDLAGDSGVEATREIVRELPHVGVLVVTMFGDEDSLFAAMRAGARGYLLKGAPTDDVERAIRTVAAGGLMLGPEVTRQAVGYLSGARTAGPVPFPELTDREREVLDLVARGYDNPSIARRLLLSHKTVRNYLSTILAKLAVRDRSALIVRAREHGLGK